MNDEMRVNICPVCKKNPCICPDNIEKPDSKTADEDSKNDEKSAKVKPPRISWI